jgi:TPR repeat protein
MYPCLTIQYGLHHRVDVAGGANACNRFLISCTTYPRAGWRQHDQDVTSTLSRAPHLSRWLPERIGANRHPAWRMAMAIALVTPTRGEADLESGNAIFEDVMKDETADGHLRGMAAAALAVSARLGRGMQVGVSRALWLYEQAIKLGHKASAHNLGLFWEGAWDAEDRSINPDRTKAIQSYRRGGDDIRCQRRLAALR